MRPDRAAQLNTAAQLRKLTQLRADAPADHHRYLFGMIELLKADVARGRPRPASDYVEMYREEFDLVHTSPEPLHTG